MRRLFALTALLLALPARAVTLIPGDIILSDAVARSLARVDPTTGDQTVVSSGGLFVELRRIAINPSGDILVTDGGGVGTASVIRVDPETGAQTLISSGGNLADPNGIVVDASGYILVADAEMASPEFLGGIVRIDPATGDQFIAFPDSDTAAPFGIAIFPIPEPSTALRLAGGLAGLAAAGRRRSLR